VIFHCITSTIQSEIRQVEHEQPKQLDNYENRLHDSKVPKEKKMESNKFKSHHHNNTNINWCMKFKLKDHKKKYWWYFNYRKPCLQLPVNKSFESSIFNCCNLQTKHMICYSFVVKPEYNLEIRIAEPSHFRCCQTLNSKQHPRRWWNSATNQWISINRSKSKIQNIIARSKMQTKWLPPKRKTKHHNHIKLWESICDYGMKIKIWKLESKRKWIESKHPNREKSKAKSKVSRTRKYITDSSIGTHSKKIYGVDQEIHCGWV